MIDHAKNTEGQVGQVMLRDPRSVFHLVTLGLLVLSVEACQRPTQVLPPAPLFEREAGANVSQVPDPIARQEPPLPADTATATPPTVPPPSSPAMDKYDGKTRINFENGSAELTAGSRSILDAQADWMIKHPEINAVLEGHADERGTRDAKLALGAKRESAMKF